MELVVDLSTGRVMLRAHEDLQRLSVQARSVPPGDGTDRGSARRPGRCAECP